MSDKNTSPPVKRIEFANGAISSGTDDSMSIETSSGQSAETKTTEDMKEYFRRLDAQLSALEDNFEQLTFELLEKTSRLKHLAFRISKLELCQPAHYLSFSLTSASWP